MKRWRRLLTYPLCLCDLRLGRAKVEAHLWAHPRHWQLDLCRYELICSGFGVRLVCLQVEVVW